MNQIVKQTKIKAPIERVFTALTSSKEIPLYFPLKSVESSWQEGSEILYRGEVNGQAFTDFGVIEVLTFPSVYQYRYWSDNHGTEKTPENFLTIRYSVEKIPEGAMLQVTQSNISSPEMFELMNNQVWGYLISSFKTYVEKNPDT